MNETTRQHSDEPAYGNVAPLRNRGATCKYAGLADGEVHPVTRAWPAAADASLEELKKHFHQKGFCVISGALSQEDVLELRREAVRLAEHWVELGERAGGFDLEPRQRGFSLARTKGKLTPNDIQKLKELQCPAFRKIDAVPFSQSYLRLACNPLIVSFVRNLVGTPGYLFLSAIFPKVAGLAREKPWHQDASYWKNDWRPSQGIVQTMTVIDPHSPDNGGLLVIPGSHRKDRPHIFDGERKLRLDNEEIEKVRALHLSPGQVLVFHSKLLHASTANRSDRDRMVVYNAYCGAELEFIGKGDRPSLLQVWR